MIGNVHHFSDRIQHGPMIVTFKSNSAISPTEKLGRGQIGAQGRKSFPNEELWPNQSVVHSEKWWIKNFRLVTDIHKIHKLQFDDIYHLGQGYY